MNTWAGMSCDVYEHGIDHAAHDEGQDGKPVQPVCQIDGIGRCKEHDDGKDHVEQPQVGHELLEEGDCEPGVV